MSRENISVPEPAYEDYDRATLVETGVPFLVDVEARDRKLKRNQRVILKDRIYKALYTKKGEAKTFFAITAGLGVFGAWNLLAYFFRLYHLLPVGNGVLGDYCLSMLGAPILTIGVCLFLFILCGILYAAGRGIAELIKPLLGHAHKERDTEAPHVYTT